MPHSALARLLCAAAALLLVTACGSSNSSGGGAAPSQSTLEGWVGEADHRLAGAAVTLYQAGTARRAGAVVMGSGVSDVTGRFELSYTAPTDANAVLYLIADGPEASARLGSVLGYWTSESDVVINERTTVALAFCYAQFLSGVQIGGPYPGIQNSALTVQNLVDPASGEMADMLSTYPNGPYTQTMGMFNALANMIAACLASPPTCASFFNQARDSAGVEPTNTLQAILNIAHNPGAGAAALFSYSQFSSLFQPSATVAPVTWTLALIYEGNGYSFDGPGNFAIDEHGDVWIGNNYTFSLDPTEANTCGDTHLIKLTADGRNAPGSPFSGGGTYGVGYGITLDPDGDVWLGNFGFQGTGCTEDVAFLANSVSQFAPDGTPVSPDRDGVISAGGYFSDTGAQPQGTVADPDGNIWIANACSSSVTLFTGGDPLQRTTFSGNGMLNPFDIAIDPTGIAWVSSNGANRVFRYDTNGYLDDFGHIGIVRPMGIATDSLGNAWMCSSGAAFPPCTNTTSDLIDAVTDPGIDDVTGAPDASAVYIQANGDVSLHAGGGVFLPWGVAVDGNDNVWFANFGGHRVGALYGANAATRPAGKQAGDELAPTTGFVFPGLVRNTGVAIDPSGNVWIANNWETIPLQTNPGGHNVVLFIGLAEPITTPLIGPPVGIGN